MPRFTDMMEKHSLGNNFSFSAVKVEKLGATLYTLVTIVIDATGSVAPFAAQLLQMLQNTIAACKKSQTSENLLVRVCTFNATQGVQELHGFKPVAEIDPAADYPEMHPSGMTPLCDAVYSAVGATNKYAQMLVAADYGCNAIFYVITDGEENASTTTMAMIREEIERATRSEQLESIISILIGLSDPGAPASTSRVLDDFHKQAGFTHFIDVGAATPGKLAKLGAFVSQSVSSQSQALGTGGPSQAIKASI
jgi:hypothetical protein